MSRRKPFDPSKQKRPLQFSEQLGAPNPHRAAKSKAGFVPEQLAVGHRRDGVVRSKERSPLTHPSLLIEMQVERTRAHVDSGQELPELGIRVPLTPSDRVTAPNRRILWQYIQTKIESELGKRNPINYEGAIRSGELHHLPLSDKQFNRRAFFEWLKHQPGWRYFTSYLDRFVELVEPQVANDPTKILTKTELGMWLLDCDGQRDAKSGADGGLAVICHGLAEAAADFAAYERRRKR